MSASHQRHAPVDPEQEPLITPSSQFEAGFGDATAGDTVGDIESGTAVEVGEKKKKKM